MELTEAQFELVADLLPRHGNGSTYLDDRHVLNAILYVTTRGCQWRALPSRFGKWNTVYTRMMRWSRAGILDRVFERLQRENIIRVHIQINNSHNNGESMPHNSPLHMARDRTANAAAIEGRLKYIWLPRMAGAFRLE